MGAVAIGMKSMFLIFLSSFALAADDPITARAFDHFYNLECDEAIDDFQKAVEAAPNDAERWNHLAQGILYRAMFRSGALESELVSGNNTFFNRNRIATNEEDHRRFDEAIRRALDLSSEALAKNAQDPKALWSNGITYAIRSNYNFLVRKAWRDSLRDATTARLTHNRLSEIEPNLVDAKLLQGLHDYIVGSLPLTYKMLGFLAGVHGDKEKGIKTLELVAQKGETSRWDAQVFLGATYRRERMPQKAIPLLEPLIQRYPRNYLFRFELVQMFADAGRKDDALKELDELEDLKRKNPPGYNRMDVAKIHYARGNLLFWYRDYDGALLSLSQVTPRANQIDPNTGMNAWLRTGQCYDMKGQRAKAAQAFKQAVAGAPDSDAGKEARKYLTSPYRRPANQ